jgi:hypothetical protein
MLHASLEDAIRSLEKWKLPSGEEAHLEQVPFADTEGRGIKLSLGQLTRYRNATVQDVIWRSVTEYLDRTSYNNTTDVASAAARLGVDVQPLRVFFPQIETLMQRRHRIVHEADRQERRSRGHHRTRSISLQAIQQWSESVEKFGQQLIRAVPA